MPKRKRSNLAKTLADDHNSAVKAKVDAESGFKVDEKGDECVLTRKSRTIRTLDDALAEGNVDIGVWEVERWVLNKWDCVAKIVKQEIQPDKSKTLDEHLEATELWQVKVWFRRKSDTRRALDKLLDDIKTAAPIGPTIKYKRPKLGVERRALEIDIMDPHFGLYCFPPGADQYWSMDRTEAFIWWAVEDLLALAEKWAPFVEIVFPFGNDYLHADNIHHTTTAGTPQPEAVSWHHAYYRGMHVAIAIVKRLREVAPVRVLQIPGNHDRQTSYTMGHVLWAYFHEDKHVTVNNSAAPFKAWEFGVNLIGFEHGHSVPAVRLSALMANEWRHAFARTHFHEWHRGDQHRVSGAKPTVLEEQGVSQLYLNALTPGNEWHRLKSYNFQKTGANGFIYSDKYGPTDRISCHVSKYTGKPLGQEEFPKTLICAGDMLPEQTSLSTVDKERTK